eukprot:2068907-Lingulodinium_polyedra.AAC.1
MEDDADDIQGTDLVLIVVVFVSKGPRRLRLQPLRQWARKGDAPEAQDFVPLGRGQLGQLAVHQSLDQAVE